jgi:hypothetical protein
VGRHSQRMAKQESRESGRSVSPSRHSRIALILICKVVVLSEFMTAPHTLPL